ncbi:hypothetical protein cyc_08295 [Cyclospora cayetanensis]|uniref:Uncharacterized protein n=1 Tax=Cyclospora cayetanensis TaxID=88456 RepID=A0A1D3D1W9_9EIME|nr:hypothetical protein cyc_08295 [Cyclospora cayetanensis]
MQKDGQEEEQQQEQLRDLTAMHIDYAGGPLRLEDYPQDTSPEAALRVSLLVLKERGVLSKSHLTEFVHAEDIRPTEDLYRRVHEAVNASTPAFGLTGESLLSVLAEIPATTAAAAASAEVQTVRASSAGPPAAPFQVSRDFVELIADLLQGDAPAAEGWAVSGDEAAAASAASSACCAVCAAAIRFRGALLVCFSPKPPSLAEKLFRTESPRYIADCNPPRLAEEKPLDLSTSHGESCCTKCVGVVQRASVGFCGVLLLPEEQQRPELLQLLPFFKPSKDGWTGEAMALFSPRGDSFFAACDREHQRDGKEQQEAPADAASAAAPAAPPAVLQEERMQPEQREAAHEKQVEVRHSPVVKQGELQHDDSRKDDAQRALQEDHFLQPQHYQQHQHMHQPPTQRQHSFPKNHARGLPTPFLSTSAPRFKLDVHERRLYESPLYRILQQSSSFGFGSSVGFRNVNARASGRTAEKQHEA